MSIPLTMRRATPADKEAICAIATAIDPHDWLPNAFEWAVGLKEPDGLFVGEMEGRVVACYVMDVPRPGEGFLFGMRVDPAVQNAGVGSAFVPLQIEEARKQGIRNLFLTSAYLNFRAHHLVEKFGFHKRGEVVVWPDITDVKLTGAPVKARPARPDDLPKIEPFRRLHMGDVAPSQFSAYTFVTLAEEDWALDGLWVVDGADGALDGLMLTSRQPEYLVIRRLEGSLEAAEDLLRVAAAKLRSEGLKSMEIGLPTRCEVLLAPLGLDPRKPDRWFLFQRKM